MLNSVELLSSVGLRREVSSFDPRMYFVRRRSGSAVGVFATQIDYILGCGEPDILSEARNFSGKRFGRLQACEGSFVHVGVELGQEEDFFAKLTQADFTKNMKLLPTPPSLRAGRQGPLLTDYI